MRYRDTAYDTQTLYEIASLFATTGRSCRRCLRSSLIATSHNSAYTDMPVTPQSVAPGTSHQARPVI